MKSFLCLSFVVWPMAVSLADSPLAKPLQPFDQNKDGKLTGQELVLARQAHNRGGKPLETNPQRIKEFMERRKAEWKRQEMKALDGNADGKLDDTEQQRAEMIWSEIAREFDQVREEILRKYDLNDDGDLNQKEREASRNESDSRRQAIERKVMEKYRSAPAGPPAQAPAS